MAPPPDATGHPCGAVRTDGGQLFVLTAVRHDDALTAALREIGAKTNEIPELAPLLEAIHDADLRGRDHGGRDARPDGPRSLDS